MVGEQSSRLSQPDEQVAAPTSTRPEYVYTWDRPGQGGFQPIACIGVTGYLFLLHADREKLQAILDRYLNTPAGGKVHYVALSDLVMLTFDKTKKLLPTTPRFQALGWTPENEASVWIVAGATRPGPFGVQILERLVFFVPYMLVEQWTAIWGGREVYGFPKELAWLDIPDDPSAGGQLTGDVVGTETFSPDAEWTRMRLLEMSPVSAAGDNSVARELDDLLGVLRSSIEQVVIPGFGFAEEFFKDIANHQFPLAFLKQIMDASDGTYASYQAIIEAPIKVQTVRQVRVLSQQFKLTVEPLDSHPIVETLGLQLDQPVHQAYWIDFDFDIELGTTICESRGTGG